MSAKQTPVWAFWQGDKPPIVELCLETVARHHPNLKVLGPDDVVNMGGEEALSLTEEQPLPFRSDLVRFWLLRKFGGLWFDSDIIALRPSILGEMLANHDLAGFRVQPYPAFSSCHFGASANTEISRQLYSRCQSIFSSGRKFLYAETSQGVLIELWRKHAGTAAVKRCEHWRFAKVPWRRAHELLRRGRDQYWESAKRQWNPNACIYHLTNRIVKEVLNWSRDDLLKSKTLLGFLLRRALGQNVRPPRAQALLDRLPIDIPLQGAEIGVAGGQLSAVLLQQRPLMSLRMVDLWEHNPSRDYAATGDQWSRVRQPRRWGDIHHRAKTAVAFAAERAILQKSDSVKAAKQVRDGSLDFVFIDDDHSESGCNRSIKAWFPKVKPGGLLSGHDYESQCIHRCFGVKEAVDAFALQHHLTVETDRDETWFVKKPTVSM